MKELLPRLDAALRRQRPEYYAGLLPGATPNEIAELEDAVRMPVPEDLRALLTWKNGHAKIEMEVGYAHEGDPLWGKYRLMGVEEIVLSCEEMRDMLEGEEWDDPDWWHGGYIPFATDWGGDYLLIDTAPHLPGRAGQIVDWAHDAPLRIMLCADLAGFIEAVVVGLESGLKDPEDDGVQYQEILKQRSPGYPVLHVLAQSDE